MIRLILNIFKIYRIMCSLRINANKTKIILTYKNGKPKKRGQKFSKDRPEKSLK